MESAASEVELSVRRAVRLIRPRNAEQLHAYVRIVLGFAMPRAALIAGHDAPFDYLVHAFFESPPAGDRVQPFRGRGRDCIVWANRGGGKTQLGAIATLLDMLFKPGIQIRILGGSFEQSEKMHRYLKALLENDVFSDLLAGAVTQRHVELRNGARVEVLSQSQCAVRGQRVHKLRCDEVELFDDEVWEAAQLVTRSGRCGDIFVPGAVEALSTMHKPFGLMQRLVKEAGRSGRGCRVFRWGVLDVLERCPDRRECSSCPLWNDCQGRAKPASGARRPRGFVRIDDAIQQRQRVGLETWASEMLCLRPNRSDSVFPEFDAKVHLRSFAKSTNQQVNKSKVDATEQASRHVLTPVTPGSLHGDVCLGGLDFGFRAPTVLLWACVTSTDESNDVLWIVDELAVNEIEAERVVALAHERHWPRPRWVGADPSGHQRNDQTAISTISLWRRAGWPVRTRASLIEDGLTAIRRRLRSGDGAVRLLIDPRCTKLIEAMTMYRWDRPQSPEARPLKDGHDHACDALRYLVVNLDVARHEVRVRDY